MDASTELPAPPADGSPERPVLRGAAGAERPVPPADGPAERVGPWVEDGGEGGVPLQGEELRGLVVSAGEEARPDGRVRRLHPLTFVVGAAREMAALVGAGATGLLVGGMSTAFYFALIGLAFGLAWHVATWAIFTYRVHEDRFESRRALVGRTVKSIPRERIRGVDISSTLGHRLLGLAIVHVDAGADGGEIVLNAVSLREAERLRRVLLARARVTPSSGPRRRRLARIRRRWFLYAPLSGAYLLTPFALAGSLLGTLYNLGDDLGLITRDRVEHLGRDAAGLPTGVVVLVILLFLTAMPIASVIVFTLFNWDFTVYERDGSIVAERGLVTRRSVALERRRVRGVELSDNPFERLAGVVRLGALVTGLGDAAHRGRLLPAAPREVAVALASGVLGPVPGPLITHPQAARDRRLVRATMPPLLAAAVWLAVGNLWLTGLCLVAAVAAVPLGLDRYRQLGHADDGVRLTVRSGSLRRRQYVVEHGAIVGWRVRRTLFQRRAGLATLHAAVGAGEGGCAAVDMSESDALALAASITPSWITPFLD
ncbi:PH domain-containing protein [Actinomadura rupiterrae]|uniref:PH domain-containing protein n=1 Tax=Actinomadura rupiterrae TaxID=559627 RepID=UPI0020A5825D|nr:PH domain-containing protein [Actinomadura rupiterrae]MCP2335805.1 putative membrane protein [Actinomadura rupiterrae]